MSAGTSGRLRVLSWAVAEPARNMALDEALLRTPGPPTLRLYGWDPPGLSLGHFQDVADFARVPGPHRLVRRITGGGAIYHERELTFALVASAGALPRQIPESYRLLHDAIAAALRDCGVPVRRWRDGAAPAARPDHPWCFAVPGLHDLVDAGGRKLLGSAQRRIARPAPRVLHHGSLVLQRPAATPFCAAVADAVDPERVLPDLCRGIVERIAAALGLAAEPGELGPDEQAAAVALVDRYRDAGSRRLPQR